MFPSRKLPHQLLPGHGERPSTYPLKSKKQKKRLKKNSPTAEQSKNDEG
jgi:hypothetical protein